METLDATDEEFFGQLQFIATLVTKELIGQLGFD